MIRQKTLFFLNLFAFSIVLALMVLPHHHHEGDVCIINAACPAEHSHNGNDNEQGQSDHQNHCDKDHVYLLEKGLIVRSNNFVHLFKTPDFSGNPKILDLHFSSPARTNIITFDPPVYALGLIHPESSLPSSYVNLSLGLRAPPMA